MVHDRIGDQCYFENVFERAVITFAKLNKQLIECASNDRRHFTGTLWVHHDVGHPAHEVFAKANLGIHDTRGAQYFAIAQITQVCGNRG